MSRENDKKRHAVEMIESATQWVDLRPRFIEILVNNKTAWTSARTLNQSIMIIESHSSV